MEESWQINRQTSPERILQKIATELNGPIGLVFMGADSERKEQQADRFITYPALQPLAHGIYAMATDGKMRYLLEQGENCALLLDSDESANRDTRLEAVNRLYNAGARTVVGVYIEVAPPAPLPGRGFLEPKTAALRTAVAQIAACPPQPEEFDYLVVIPQQV